MPDKKYEVWNDVYTELLHADPLVRTNISHFAAIAVERQNPAFIDYALVLCTENHITPPQSLINLLSTAASFRLSGGTITKKEAIAPQKESAIFSACLWTFKLVHFGKLTKEQAINLACTALSSRHPNFQIKNSYLDKTYNQWSKNNRNFLEGLKKQNPWSESDREEYIASFPDKIPQGLKGTRR